MVMLVIPNRKILLIPAGLILVVLIWYLFPSDTRVIKGQLKTMAEQMSFPKSEHPLETIKRSRIIGQYIAKDLDISITHEDVAESKIISNKELQQNIIALGRKIAPVNVELKDLNISIENKQSARANFTAIVSRASGGADSQPESYAQEIESNWNKIEGEWLLSEIRNIEVIEWRQ